MGSDRIPESDVIVSPRSSANRQAESQMPSDHEQRRSNESGEMVSPRSRVNREQPEFQMSSELRAEVQAAAAHVHNHYVEESQQVNTHYVEESHQQYHQAIGQNMSQYQTGGSHSFGLIQSPRSDAAPYSGTDKTPESDVIVSPRSSANRQAESEMPSDHEQRRSNESGEMVSPRSRRVQADMDQVAPAQVGTQRVMQAN